uniref:Glycosyl transferase, group 2 family n=1 Tax=mine drainage metagenome TaxID=410659 RepID=E6QMG0_9ZZZZ
MSSDAHRSEEHFEADGNAAPAVPFITVSVILVSYQTREVLRECLRLVERELRTMEFSGGGSGDVLVVDNCSSDGSAAMVAEEFPWVRLFRSEVNLGFGGANNLALRAATGRFLLLLNSDAFLEPGVLTETITRMNAAPEVGIGGVAQVGRDGSRQPSARRFHSLWRDAMMMTGLAECFRESRLWGRLCGGLDRRWSNATSAVDVDWIPGAFLLIRREVLDSVGLFDCKLFLYLEEVDLCRRTILAGWKIRYWPDLKVIHLGGESSKSVNASLDSPPSHQVVLWQMRSTLLYYRKWHGITAAGAAALEIGLYGLRWLRNRWSHSPQRRIRARHAAQFVALMRQAWRDTRGGRVSPQQPW